MKPNPIGMFFLGILGAVAGLLAQGIRLGGNPGFTLILGGVSCMGVFLVCLLSILECGFQFGEDKKLKHYLMCGIGGSFLGVGLAITLTFTFIGWVAAATLVFLFILMMIHVVMLQFDVYPNFFWGGLYLVGVFAIIGTVMSIMTGNYGICISMPVGSIDVSYLAALGLGIKKYKARATLRSYLSIREDYDTSNPNSIASQMVRHNDEYNKILNKKAAEIEQLQHELKEIRTAGNKNTILEDKYKMAHLALTLIAEASTSENSVTALQQHAELTLKKLRA